MLSFREKILRSCRQLAEWTDKEGEEGKEYCSISTYLICLFRLYVAILVQYATTNSKHTYKVLYRSATSPSLSAWSVHLAKLPTQTGYGTYGGTADGTNCCFLYWAEYSKTTTLFAVITISLRCMLSVLVLPVPAWWVSSRLNRRIHRTPKQTPGDLEYGDGFPKYVKCGGEKHITLNIFENSNFI